MPVTAKLSKAFYERFGEQVANELVEWFNLVDATYRADLRELNEVNYARFEAKLEQRLSEFRSEMQTEFAGLRAELAGLRAEFTGLRAESTGLRAELRAELASARAEMERRLGEQTRWMFLCWATLLASNIALWMRSGP